MRRNALQLSRWHKLTLYAATAAVFLSGAVWAWLHWFARIEGEFGPQPHPAEPWLIRIHGGAAMAILVILGTLLPIHVKRGWQARQNRLTGTGLLVFFALLTVSGYGLYYSGGESLRAFTSLAHTWIGLALPAIIVWHVVTGHRLRRLGKLRRTVADRAAKDN
jgi:cation transport ATPase